MIKLLYMNNADLLELCSHITLVATDEKGKYFAYLKL